MKRNRKAFIILIITVLAVLVVGAVTTTYAWFLSRYAAEYDFVLNSQSPMILKYEANLDFASGTRASAGNLLIPATQKVFDSTGTPIPTISQPAFDPLDVFDVDTVDPAHTGKVATAAQAVKYTASGAFWTGEEQTIGAFTPELHVFKSSFLSSAALRTYLGTFSEQTAVTEENLLSLLSEEEHEVSQGGRLINENDLVRQGEVSFIMVIEYLGETFLYYDGAYYVLGAESGSAFILPAAAESNAELRYWHTPTALNSTLGGEQISDGSYFHLLPNSTFSFNLYVFMARTDEQLDAEINGQTMTIFSTLTVVEAAEEPAEPAEPEEP